MFKYLHGGKITKFLNIIIKLTLMLFESVRNIVKRSIPRPQPAVGGKPYSNDVQKFSSINCASSSPAALSC